MRETQESIRQWRHGAVGIASNYARTVSRANEEMAELLTTVTETDQSQVVAKASDECADILIVLFGVADILGFDLLAEVDKKMEINRGRTWRRTGDGHGYHT